MKVACVPTKRQAELLQLMADGEEMVESGREVWIGLERTNYQTANLFHVLMWVSSDEQSSDKNYRVFYISERGLAALARYKEAQ